MIESKLVGQETHEKLKKYAEWLGANQCAIVSSKWDEVIRAIESMPEPNRKEAIVVDFVEYLESFPGLLGFRGFKGNFFSEELRAERLHELRLLCNSLVPGKFSQWGQKKFDPSGDFDLYTWDQFALIGNVGMATWDDRYLWVKLVVGMTSFVPDVPDQLQQIQEKSGHTHPLGPTYWGTRLLLGADQAAVAAVFERLTQALTGVEFGVGFRLWFHRFREFWINSKPIPFENQDSWRQVAEVLRRAECSGPISPTTLQDIEPYVDDSNRREFEAARDELAATVQRQRRPTHQSFPPWAIRPDADTEGSRTRARRAAFGKKQAAKGPKRKSDTARPRKRGLRCRMRREKCVPNSTLNC